MTGLQAVCRLRAAGWVGNTAAMPRINRWRLLVAVLAVGASMCAGAVEVQFKRVAEGVYAHIGDTAGRSYENEGLNANIGLVVTAAGAVLIDSGASFQSARQIHAAVAKVTQQPVKWVINTGGQDQRWLGNGYFAGQGAEVIAHARAKVDMLARGGEQVAVLREVLRERADGTVPTLPTRTIATDDAQLTLGGMRLELRHRGGAHTPGEMMVWLPDSKVLFAGDVVYVDRMLSVLPVSNTRSWLRTFTVIEDLQPQHIVPGHGRVTNLAGAQAATRDYLLALRAFMKKAVDEGTDVSAAAKAFNALPSSAPFARLRHGPDLMPANASWTYIEIERD